VEDRSLSQVPEPPQATGPNMSLNPFASNYTNAWLESQASLSLLQDSRAGTSELGAGMRDSSEQDGVS
jgi:hypothetical protein